MTYTFDAERPPCILTALFLSNAHFKSREYIISASSHIRRVELTVACLVEGSF